VDVAGQKAVGRVTAAGDRTGSLSKGRQHLAAELRRLRELAGVSGRELATRIGISQSKVSRFESARAIPSLPEARAWGRELDVSVEMQERLISLTEAVYTEVHPWRVTLRQRGHVQDHMHEQEALAHRVRNFQCSVVPGLLQTAEYARRVFSLFEVPYADEDLANAVAVRLSRQLAIYEGDKQFQFLITEAALRWRPGPPKLLLAQLDRIASISTLDNVSIGLIPLANEAHTAISHGFVIFDGYDGDDQDGFVTVETIHANMTVSDPADVALYRNSWDLLHQMAIFEDEARAFLADLTGRLRVAPD
jgi:transcriptional regulator with XRE-family HTH domain